MLNTALTATGTPQISLTYVVEAARCQALGQMCGKQEACEGSQGDVVVVEDVGIIVCASIPYTQEHL